MEEPDHVLAAPAHPDPYPWYARQRRQRPICRDPVRDLWVVSDPALVRQALCQPLLRVRPPAEPVPRTLQGRLLGEVFSLLVRMNDGAFHARHRPDVEKVLAGFDGEAVAVAAQAAARELLPRCRPDALLSGIAVHAMARLLGVPVAQRDRTADWVQAFTHGIAAAAPAEAVERADRAARALVEQGERAGLQRVAAVHRIACMQQALDATAGLLGNAIVAALAQDGDEDARGLVARVARSDPAIHNTRRFAAADVRLGGERIAAGEGLVLVLVAASPFGAGAHACPGEGIALQIAAAALQALREAAPLARTFGARAGYRPLPNARIPVFTA